MDIVDDLRDLNSMHTPKEVSDIGEKAANEIERLRSQMDLFDPSTTKEMAAAALNFANDEIKRLQERNHVLRGALQHILTHCKSDKPPNAQALILFVNNALGEKE